VKQRYGLPDAKIARIFNPIDLEKWRPFRRSDARAAARRHPRRRMPWADRHEVTDRTVVQRILSAADAYVMASRRERFPVAPVEAMALGLPVVATDASGVPDIFEGGELHGGLVVPRDDAEALATALGRVLDDPALRRRLGERARARVEEGFSPAAIGRQLRDFVLGGR